MNNVNISILTTINQIKVLIMLVYLILLEYNNYLYSSNCWHVYYISYSNVTYILSFIAIINTNS